MISQLKLKLKTTPKFWRKF